MPATRGATGAGFPLRRRALTRPRAGPRRGVDLARRPETPSNARRRSVARFAVGLGLGTHVRWRADFFPRVFAFLTLVFLAVDLFAADFRAAFAAFLFFLRLVVIRIAVSRRRAERAIGDRTRCLGRSGRGWRRRLRRGRLLRRAWLLRRGFFRRGFTLRRGFLRGSFLFLCGRFFLGTVASRRVFLLRRCFLGLLLRFRLLRLAGHDRPPHGSVATFRATARDDRRGVRAPILCRDSDSPRVIRAIAHTRDRLRHRPAIRPVEKLDRVRDGDGGGGG